MGNTEDKKDVELKRIPRNPKIPIKDEEVNAVLKEAAKQISEKNSNVEKSLGVADNKVADLKDAKPGTASGTTKVSESEVKENTARENINLKNSGNMESADKKSQNAKAENDKAKNDKAKNVTAKPSDDISENRDVKSADGKKSNDAKPQADKKDIKGTTVDTKKNNQKTETAKSNFGKDFKVEDEVYVSRESSDDSKAFVKNYKMTKGEVVGSVFEGIWTGIKLVVLFTIITAIVGFFMSRDLLIRGRSGEQISKQNMNVAGLTASTRLEERKEGKKWNEKVKKQKLTMTADDGKILVAQKIVVSKNSNDWVVILHGQNGTIEDIYDLGSWYAEEGYNILMPDLRAHGESEGSFYGMGWLDRLDVINWVDVILDDHPSANVVIHGIDLGADTALMLSGEPLKDSIKAIVAEGAYTSAWDVVKTEYKARHDKWPVFPILHMVNPVAKVWGGYSLKEADAVKQVKNAKIPILLIRGQNDTYVTEAMTEDLNKAIASEHEVLTIASGTHEDCRFAEPDTYYSKVLEFVEKHIK